MKRLIWLVCGLLALAFGLVGIVLPLLPTVPFLLLAAICFARSSEQLHLWLVEHPTLGPPIADWKRAGAIRRRAKVLASVSLVVAFVIPLSIGVRVEILLIQVVVLACVAIFIWSRPEA